MSKLVSHTSPSASLALLTSLLLHWCHRMRFTAPGLVRVQQNDTQPLQRCTRMQPSHRNPTDRKNRVLMMDDDLRPDLLERAESWADKADLCIAMGTSLCGSMVLQPPSRLDRSSRACLLTATAWLARPHSDC